VNGGAGKKANLDIVGGGEGSVAGGRGHGWGADLANGTLIRFEEDAGSRAGASARRPGTSGGSSGGGEGTTGGSEEEAQRI